MGSEFHSLPKLFATIAFVMVFSGCENTERDAPLGSSDDSQTDPNDGAPDPTMPSTNDGPQAAGGGNVPGGSGVPVDNGSMADDPYDPGADPMFKEAFIDVDEWRDEPVRHRYVHGGFKDTDLRFSIYFPPEDKYEGRFFHYILPVPGNEHAVANPEYPDPSYSIGFAVASGAYLVESNMGALGFDATANPEITLWRASAATAHHSRALANMYYPAYGEHRPYGYAWGGSGGAFKTIACIESTEGIWDGVVPFIHGSPVAMPNNFTVQAHAMRLLRSKLPAIVDAVDPGGSGDMYAGLDADERAALEEITKFGFPKEAWFNYETIAFGYTGVLASLLPAVMLLDKTYVDDFWSMPGYAGADSPDLYDGYRIDQTTTVTEILLPADAKAIGLPLTLSASQPSNAQVPAAFKVADLPEGDLQGASFVLTSGEAADTSVTIAGEFDGWLAVGYGTGGNKLKMIQAGDEVQINNDVYLALQSYHRHQIPGPEYAVYDQYRDERGEPLFPQRMVKTTELFNQAGDMSGRFKGKMIVVANLMDEIAFPWHADWYRARVKAALGDQFESNYRLWFIERAMHTPPKTRDGGVHPAITTRVIDFGPVLQQALRDLVAWVEMDIAPPPSTRYDVADGQVRVPATAAERMGLQPVVTAMANGGERADVVVGEEVTFTAIIEAPPGTGSVVGVEWDFEGDGDFPATVELTGTSSSRMEIETTHTFDEPGTYFPAVRGSTHRDGDANTPYGRIPNLGRVRVVVE